MQSRKPSLSNFTHHLHHFEFWSTEFPLLVHHPHVKPELSFRYPTPCRNPRRWSRLSVGTRSPQSPVACRLSSLSWGGIPSDCKSGLCLRTTVCGPGRHHVPGRCYPAVPLEGPFRCPEDNDKELDVPG